MQRILQICNDLNNVGDRLASIITERLFGYEVVRVFKDVPPDLTGKPILGGLGSFLGYYGEWPLHVWGTGYEPGYVDSKTRAHPGSRLEWTIHAVRGHVTRTFLKLPSDVPVGDPAILMPRLYSPKSTTYEKIRYFLHCDNDESPPLIPDIPVVSTRQDPFDAIDQIASSGFVFTEALHVAILAYAYSVPWAWSLNKHTRGMVKWYDWFSAIGIPPRCFWYGELSDAQKWYRQSRTSFQRLDPNRLVAAFPHQIAFDIDSA